MALKTKVITISALAVFLTVGVVTAILLEMQNRRMLDAEIGDVQFLSDIIDRTTGDLMLEGSSGKVQKVLEGMAQQREIKVLRIVSPEGVILRSTDKTEIGQKSDRFNNYASTGYTFGPITAEGQFINYFQAIRNRPGCYGCHDGSRPVMGFIQITHDMTRNRLPVLAIKRQMVVSYAFIVVVLSGILTYLFSRLVMKPLGNLLEGIRQVESGNLETKVAVGSNDELGVIGSSFNKMVAKINNLYKEGLARERDLSRVRLELEHKNEVELLNAEFKQKIIELEKANEAITSLSREVKSKNLELEKAVEKLKKINEVGRVLSSIIDTKELMKIIIRTTADLLDAEKITMYLKNSQRPELAIRYRKGFDIEHITDFSSGSDTEYSALVSREGPVFMPVTGKKQDKDNVVRRSRVGVPLRMKGKIIGSMLLENETDGCSFTEDELDILTTLSNQAMVAIENAWLYESVKTNYFATIQSLVNALEASDRFTKGHSERVRILSIRLGKHMGLDFKELELLEHASILHDIGKIGIDTFILQKQGRLTSKEYGLIKTHPLIGDEILGPIGTLEGVRKTIIQHHERYDGAGYPYGLRGDEISLKSKILSVVDTFDAMMTDRPYRKARSLEEVKRELITNSGTQFDPLVVDAFTELLNGSGEKILSEAGYNLLYSSL